MRPEYQVYQRLGTTGPRTVMNEGSRFFVHRVHIALMLSVARKKHG